MPMNMERSARDIAGGYLLLMLAQGEKQTTTSSTTKSNPIDNHNNVSNNILLKSQANSNWNPYDSAMIHKHHQLGLYASNAALQESILSLSSRHHNNTQSYYWGAAEIDKSRYMSSFHLSHHRSPYKLVQDRSFESRVKPLSLPLNYHHHSQGPPTNNTKRHLEEVEARQLTRPTEPKSQVRCSQPPSSPSSQGSRMPPEEDEEDSLPTPTSDKIPLPLWFTQSTTTVVIGKGHLPRKTPGNYLLRQLVRDHLQAYQESNRRGRATIVSTIYQKIRSMNLNGKNFGNFSVHGEWQEAKEHAARDKIAATFRDCLCDFYKSSTKSKVAKRRIRKAAETNTSRQQQQQAQRC